jgi:hypothetical protein
VGEAGLWILLVGSQASRFLCSNQLLCEQRHQHGWASYDWQLLSSLQVYELPFLVALDHRKESVVVAVRGTMSLQVMLAPGSRVGAGSVAQ